MILREVTGLRLALSLAAGLALFGVRNASAGLLLTVEALTDFPIVGSVVDYQSPTLTIKSKSGDVEYQLESEDSTGGGLYLSSQSIDNAKGWKVSVFDELGAEKKVDTDELLRGSLEKIIPADSPDRFDFLLKGNTIVSGELADQIGSAGLFVQIAGLDGGQWTTISQSLASLEGGGSRALAGLANPNNPAIPLPGTLVLLILGTIPLAASRRRR
jgi:DNA-binding transcriptional ArsR family regulator